MNEFIRTLASHLEDVDWELHLRASPLYDSWSVESREEFAYATTAQMEGVREGFESGKCPILSPIIKSSPQIPTLST